VSADANTFTPNIRPDCTDVLTAALRERIMVIDGAMGTAIQRDRPDEAGYRGERFIEWPTALQGNNDLLNLTQPQIIEGIHREYLEAGADIHIATRMNTASIFSMHNPVAVINNTTSTEWNPWISHDGLLMYFVSDRTGNFEIYKTTRANKSSPFGEPMPVGKLNTPADEHSPVLSEDGLEIFFGSKRANPGSDIFHATRSTPGAEFGDPTLLAELSGSVSDDFPSWASPDHCQLMFTSNRVDGGGGAYHLWMATRR